MDDHEKAVSPPRTFSCDSSGHLGRKRRFPLGQGYVQRVGLAEDCDCGWCDSGWHWPGCSVCRGTLFIRKQEAT